MPRTPISTNLIHNTSETEENAKLFDGFASLLEVSSLSVELTEKELQEIISSNLLEKIRRKVSEEGEFKLPFGLVVKRR